MELPPDLVPLIVAATDFDTAAVLACVCTAAYGAATAKMAAKLGHNQLEYDDKIMWLRKYLYVFSQTTGDFTIYYIVPGPDIVYNDTLSCGTIIIPPRMLVKKYYDWIAVNNRSLLTSS